MSFKHCLLLKSINKNAFRAFFETLDCFEIKEIKNAQKFPLKFTYSYK